MRILAAALLFMGISGVAMATCPSTPTDCPNPTLNGLTSSGAVNLLDGVKINFGNAQRAQQFYDPIIGKLRIANIPLQVDAGISIPGGGTMSADLIQANGGVQITGSYDGTSGIPLDLSASVLTPGTLGIHLPDGAPIALTTDGRLQIVGANSGAFSVIYNGLTTLSVDNAGNVTAAGLITGGTGLSPTLPSLAVTGNATVGGYVAGATALVLTSGTSSGPVRIAYNQAVSTMATFDPVTGLTLPATTITPAGALTTSGLVTAGTLSVGGLATVASEVVTGNETVGGTIIAPSSGNSSISASVANGGNGLLALTSASATALVRISANAGGTTMLEADPVNKWVKSYATLLLSGNATFANGINPLLWENQAVTGTGSSTATLVNLIQSSSENVANAAGLNFFDVSHTFGGGALTGPRNTVLIQSSLTAATGNAKGGTASYTALDVTFNATANNNGTAASAANVSGAVFVFNPVMHLSPAATFYSGAVGQETDMWLESGSSVLNKFGQTIVALNGDATSGSVFDAALALNNGALIGSGTVGWQNGIDFGAGGHWPIKAAGTLINAEVVAGDSTATMTATNGIDWHNVTFTGNTWNDGHVSISSAGIVSALGLKLPQTTPANSSVTCTIGSIFTDASFIYACTASNVWKRATLSTF